MTVKKMVQQGHAFRRYTMGSALVRDEPTLRGRGEPLIVDGSWAAEGGLRRGYMVSVEKIREMDEGELVAAVVQTEPQPSELELRVLYGLWSQVPPTRPDFEPAYQRFVNACRRAGWGLSPKARAASSAAGKEQTMTRTERPEPHVRLDAAAKAYSVNNGVPYDQAVMLVGQGDPQLLAEYLPLAAPKAAPLVTPTPWSEAAAEVAERAKAYANEKDVSIDAATAAIFTADRALRKCYLSAPTPSKQYGLIAEQTEDELLYSLTEAELVDHLVERRLGPPGISPGQADTLGQIHLYDWLTRPGGLPHGSPAAAARRDAVWKIVLTERFRRYGHAAGPVGR